MDRRFVAASAVVRSLYRSVVVKRKLRKKAKLSFYRSIFLPVLTYEGKNEVPSTSRQNPPWGGWALP